MARQWTRHLARGALALSVALAVATPAQALTWCNAMQRAMPKCCCEKKVASAVDVPAVGRTACCETRAPETQAPASLHDSEVKTPSPVLAALFTLAPPPAPALPDLPAARDCVHQAGAREGPGRAVHERNAVWLI